ncbi:ABC transporter permease [Haladaptatus halobius]|uniref:ABC transporter permease n=1 Tax=Haladaptatus halobius TaxID=2884875 RepID=UPI001D09B256|nr:ABC transporter permease [Haladaptatus halobius]
MAIEGQTAEQATLTTRATNVIRALTDLYRRLDRSARLSFWVVSTITVTAFAAPIVAPYNPIAPHYDAALHGPSARFILGTDLTGRDVFSRLVYGARISLLVGIGAVALAMSIGVPLGSVAGYVGGWTDEALMRLTDVMISFPALVLALALVGALGPSLQNVIIVIGVVYSPQYARLIRGSVLSVKEEEYVEAARNTGLGDVSILFKHVIPNAFAPVLVQATFHVATAIIFEASLSFLGLGVQPPTPTWGEMIATGRDYLPAQWWISTFPGLAILLTVLSLNLLGDGLRDEFDPRSATKGGPEA